MVINGTGINPMCPNTGSGGRSRFDIYASMSGVYAGHVNLSFDSRFQGSCVRCIVDKASLHVILWIHELVSHESFVTEDMGLRRGAGKES